MVGAYTKMKVVALGLFLFIALALPISAHSSTTANNQNGSWGDYEYVCPANSSSLSPISVLAATGEHNTLISLLKEHDPEGFAILSDPKLADKTVWAPLDSAFEKSSDDLKQLNSTGIKKVLGYHINPPRSRLINFSTHIYTVVTPNYIATEGEIQNRTRTGTLTRSEQRTVTSKLGNKLYVEDISVLPSSWCTAAGSVFSIDEVILDVAMPSFSEKLKFNTIRYLFYDDTRFFIYSFAGSIALSSLVVFLYRSLKKRRLHE